MKTSFMNFNALLNELKLDKSEFLFQFQSHPNYPSALAFSDTLRFLGIENEAYELEKEYWNEIDQDFITVFGNQISLVKKSDDVFKVYSDDVKTVSFEHLKQNSTGLVMLMNKEKQKEKKYTEKHWVWAVVILFLFVLAYLITDKWNHIIFNLFSLVGVFISIEIFKEKFGDTSPVLSNICGKTAAQDSSSCERIMAGDKVNFFGLKLSDISLLYFSGIAVLGLFFPAVEGFLFWISLLASLVIFYSVYVQIFIEKTLCRICLLIIVILLAQAGIAFFTFTSQFKVVYLLFIILLFVLIFFGLKFISRELTEKQTLKKESAKNLRFKRNYELFELLLNRNPEIHFRNKFESFFFGQKDADLHISLISNPFCGFCAEAHRIIEELLFKYPEQVSVQIRFNYLENSNPDLKKVISVFKFIYNSEGEAATLRKMHDWFTEKNLKKSQEIDVDLNEEISVGNENFSHGFSFTPVILINGRQFPNMYDRNDILYFVDDLIEN